MVRLYSTHRERPAIRKNLQISLETLSLNCRLAVTNAQTAFRFGSGMGCAIESPWSRNSVGTSLRSKTGSLSSFFYPFADEEK